MVPGLGLTILGLAGVGLSLAGIARTFIEGMHAISALMMFIGMIIFAAGILKDGLPSSNTAKAAVVIIIGFLVSFGTFVIGMSSVTSLSLFAGVLLLITIPAIVIAYAAHKQSTHFKAIAILFSSASVVGAIAFVSFGFVAPQPIEAGVLEPPPTPEELGPKVEIKILEGASVEGAPAYDPTEIRVEKGTFIVWTNDDPVIHSVTSGMGFDDPNYGTLFDSSAIRSQTTFSLDTSKLELGEYEYFCTFHPFMKAKFLITGGGTATGESTQEPAEDPEETPMPEVPAEEKSMAPNMVNVEITAGSADVNNPEFYIPREIAVSIDTTVVWTNMDTVGHTVTSGNPGGSNTGSLFDSNFPLMENGETFEYTFDTVGEYPYFCQVHPWMVGKVIVK
jgi:plastocyanin